MPAICPNCKIPLVLRRGRFGEFLGCRNYPQCRFTRNIANGPTDDEYETDPLLDPDGRYNATIEIVRDHTYRTVYQFCRPKGPETDRRLKWLMQRLKWDPATKQIREFSREECNELLEACGELTMTIIRSLVDGP